MAFYGGMFNDQTQHAWDALYGGDGHDSLGTSLAATGDGGRGDDNIFFYDGGFGSLYGGDGADAVWGSYGEDRFYGGEGGDYLIGNWETYGTEGDTLYGGGGGDALYGEGGNDILYGESGDDAAFIFAADARTWNTELLASYQAGLFGGDGADVIFGGDGNVLIVGGTGKDNLTGGPDHDLFVFDSRPERGNVDKIFDFKHKVDFLVLDKTIFTNISKDGNVDRLDPAQFYEGAHAHDANDRIIYDDWTGNLYWDKNGYFPGQEVLIAKLVNFPWNVTAGDIVIG